MMRFNYIRILLILMLCAGVLSAQGPALDSLTIIQDTMKSAFSETDSLAAVSLPGDTLKAQTQRGNSLAWREGSNCCNYWRNQSQTTIGSMGESFAPRMVVLVGSGIRSGWLAPTAR